VSGQVVLRALPAMLSDPNPQRVGRVMRAILQMDKLDLGVLQRAQAGADRGDDAARAARGLR
jgi:hypothetical protein